jgi:CRP-like cAMP-binding protein
LLEDVLNEVGDLPQFHVEAGVDVVVEGDDRGQLLILLDGAVEVRRGGVVLGVIDQPGEVFGEVSTLLGSAPSATVTTLQPSRFRVAGNPHTVLEERPLLALAVAQLLAKRLEASSQHVVDLVRKQEHPAKQR